MHAEEYTSGIRHIAEAINYAICTNEDRKPSHGYDWGTGICYYNETFTMHGFWNHESDDNFYTEHTEIYRGGMVLFHHHESGFTFEWYKRIGRSVEVLSDEAPKLLEWYEIVLSCLKSIRDDENPVRKCKYEEECNG